ncbi:MAG TPA: DUF1549 and DUF1553 domain-containing protein [Gemmataceae bacterium]|nr:DUF1549 and DUF1553 domain-containing protein [Gemmataceae bacterium]
MERYIRLLLLVLGMLLGPGLRAEDKQGAPALRPKARIHWAFRPAVRPPAPTVQRSGRVRGPVDRFIEAALERKGLSLGPEADRVTLIRRVSFDLTGLPPSPAEVDAFLGDQHHGAYERMVERYLASAYYGARWGKYWLDAAGYADSNGYFSADSDRPLAYRYRDYVIGSFNRDKPYDRFVREQLAGDEMAGYVPGGDVTPAMVELLTATHFLRNAQDGTGESDGNPDEVRTDRFSVLEGNLQITMNCLLGITIQCARCHAHKFEPIRHQEYYGLEAVLYPAYCPDRWTKPNDRVVTVGTRARREEHLRHTQQIDRQVKALVGSLAAIADPFREQLREERLRALEPGLRAAVLKAANTPAEKRTAEQQSLVGKNGAALKPGDDDLAGRFPEYAAVRDRIRQAVATRERARPPPLEQLAVLVETDPKPLVHHLLLRGRHNAPGRAVAPMVPVALCTPGNHYDLQPRPQGRITSGRRSAFARWVTSPDNPLFARVMVNRIWQHHFGAGIVATPDNLGQSGARPTHPEVLDYVATEFVHSGWSVKAVHRLILASAVYRQAGTLREAAARIDPDNKLLWQFPLRRLDAEALRDSMLAVSGELDPRMGGPYIPTRRTDEGSVDVDENQNGARRRSVYLQQRRTQVPTLLELFDAPALAANCSFRNTSTVPLQSLALLNAPFTRARAQAFARRLERQAGADAARRVTLAFRLACGRSPGARETAAAHRFLKVQQALYAAEKDASRRVWTDFCQMILAGNAFLYVE